MSRSPLYELERLQGASFTTCSGWEVVQAFAQVNLPARTEEELRIIRQGVGIVDLCHRGKLRLRGEDRVRFLHGMVTNDIQGLKEEQGCYAAMLTAKGKMLADLVVYRLADSLLLELDDAYKERLAQTLERYIIADDVQIEDMTKRYGLLSLQGPRARQLLNVLPGINSHDLEKLDSYGHLTRELMGTVVLITRHGRTGEEGFDLFVMELPSLVPIWQILLKDSLPLGGGPTGIAALELARIEAGLPRYGVDMDENTILLEAGLDQAISYTKGCYIGQEVVARATYRGHINRRLSGLLIHGTSPPAAGEQIYQGEKAVGWVTSTCFSPSLQRPIALGYVHRECLEGETAGLQIAIQGNPTPLEVVPLPFYHHDQAGGKGVGLA